MMSTTLCAGCNVKLASHEITLGCREGFTFPATASYQVQFSVCAVCAEKLLNALTPSRIRRQAAPPNGGDPASSIRTRR